MIWFGQQQKIRHLIFNMSGHLHTIHSALVYDWAPLYGITPTSSLRCRTNALRGNAVIRRPCSRLRYFCRAVYDEYTRAQERLVDKYFSLLLLLYIIYIIFHAVTVTSYTVQYYYRTIFKHRFH